jgi:hypothetical protein
MSHNFQKCPLFYHRFNEEAFSSATDLCTVTVEMVNSLSSELLNFIFSPYTVFTHLISLFSPYTVFTRNFLHFLNEKFMYESCVE